MTGHRIGLDLFNDVLDVLHRHGFTRGDDLHAGRAIFLISDLYEAWWDKRAPERTRAERAAAAAARKRAIAGDWCAPAALDDDQLDIPGYRPQYGWKPATGTGVARDIRPRARRHRRRRGA